MFASIVKVAQYGFGIVNKLLGRRERLEHEASGAAKANEERNKEARDVEERMDSVDRPASDDVTDSLHDGKF